MAKAYKFLSKGRAKNLRTWVGNERIEFSNNIFETDDKRIASALISRCAIPMPKGLKGQVFLIKDDSNKKDESPKEQAPEKPEESSKAESNAKADAKSKAKPDNKK